MEDRISFEDGMQELEALVERLESGQMSLEDSFAAYARAVELKNALGALLDEGDRRIRVLTEGGERELAAGEDT